MAGAYGRRNRHSAEAPVDAADPDGAGGRRAAAVTAPLTTLTIRIVAVAANFAAVLVTARTMRLRDFGVVAVVTSLLLVLAIPADRGYENAAIRFVATAEPAVLRTLVRHLLRQVVVSGLALAGVLVVAAIVLGGVGLRDPTAVAASLALLVPVFAVVRLGEGVLRGAGSNLRAQVSSGVVVPVLTTAGMLAVRDIGHAAVSLAAALIVRSVATVAAAILVACFVRRRLGRRGPEMGVPLSRELVADLRRVSVGLLTYAGFNALVTQIDVPAVAAIGTAREAGVYAVAARVALTLNVASVAVNFTLAPRVARLHRDRDWSGMQRELQRASLLSVGLIVPPLLAYLAWPDAVLRIFGSHFAQGAHPLEILLVGQLVSTLCGPVGTAMNMSGLQWPAAWILGASAGVDLVLLAVLIPVLGVAGAAVSTTTALAAWNVGLTVYLRRRLGITALPLLRGRRLETLGEQI
jgi:O-antigen/teichoic acid export membrane protein